jgi:hypothetical protein
VLLGPETRGKKLAGELEVIKAWHHSPSCQFDPTSQPRVCTRQCALTARITTVEEGSTRIIVDRSGT